jgi:hypothetical protein
MSKYQNAERYRLLYDFRVVPTSSQKVRVLLPIE